jgi:anti-anti-sigma factor
MGDEFLIYPGCRRGNGLASKLLLQNGPIFSYRIGAAKAALDGSLGVVPEEGGLDINVRKRSQVQLIQLRGQLRLGDPVDELQRTLDEALAEGDTRFVINLSEVPMLDSSGIGLLVRFLASAKRRGGSLKLVNPSSFAQKTLRVVGVLSLFEVFDDDDKAVESFT